MKKPGQRTLSPATIKAIAADFAAAVPDLPGLIGSPSQVKWATSIRAEAMAKYDLPPDLLKVNKARVWIDRKKEWE